ncbi:uncharacterized protein LOC143218248 [Lasioglossum baleicum]|uniref:uncharacterized protein LOC143218248 n=1 Tax=Lasioglossum baleicum TaxID=434251 RepID=UPI003FCEA1A7
MELSDVAPYARHTAKISACNSSFCSEDWEFSFSTSEAEIPSETFSNIRLERLVLSWRPPEDCSTITDPMKARIIITGVSKAVENFNLTIQTAGNKLNLPQELYGAEDYVAKIYVIRNWDTPHNESAMRTIPFTTPTPKSPAACERSRTVRVQHQNP